MKWYKIILWSVVYQVVISGYAYLVFPSDFYTDMDMERVFSPGNFWFIFVTSNAAFLYMLWGIAKGIKVWANKVTKFVEDSKND